MANTEKVLRVVKDISARLFLLVTKTKSLHGVWTSKILSPLDVKSNVLKQERKPVTE